MKPAIFEEVENQLINALISHDLHGDAQCIDRLAQAMVYVLTELQSQEAGDVD